MPITTVEQINALVEGSAPESVTLDYKRELPSGGKDDRREFVADVTAMANTAGGTILFGVDENGDGEADDALGVDATGLDESLRRLTSWAQTCIAPRIPGLTIDTIDGFARGPVVAVNIPRSWAAPHMVAVGESRFWQRHSRGKDYMDVNQIRAAFTLGESLRERLRTFRAERAAAIRTNDTYVRLFEGPRIILHMLPLTMFDSDVLDVKQIEEASNRLTLEPLCGHTTNFRYNFDGYLKHTDAGDEERGTLGYLQLFRSGAIEAVDSFTGRGAGPNNDFIPSQTFEELLRTHTPRYLSYLARMEVPAPVLVMLSLVGFRGYKMAMPNGDHFIYERGDRSIDRDMLLVPDVLVDDLSIDGDDLLDPIIDTVWNSSGVSASPYRRVTPA